MSERGAPKDIFSLLALLAITIIMSLDPTQVENTIRNAVPVVYLKFEQLDGCADNYSLILVSEVSSVLVSGLLIVYISNYPRPSKASRRWPSIVLVSIVMKYV